jgi:hypothetical protein
MLPGVDELAAALVDSTPSKLAVGSLLRNRLSCRARSGADWFQLST